MSQQVRLQNGQMVVEIIRNTLDGSYPKGLEIRCIDGATMGARTELANLDYPGSLERALNRLSVKASDDTCAYVRGWLREQLTSEAS